MIAFLDGILVESLPTQIVMDVNGTGYQVLIPLSSFEKLPQVGEKTKILTHLIVREDAHILFGFATAAERDLFRLLIGSVSGVGPKIALAVLSGMSVEDFKAYVVSGDAASISKIKGLGKKTAELMIVELKNKVGVAAEWEAASNQQAEISKEATAIRDAVLALISLGYKQVDAHKALKAITSDTGNKDLDVEALIRAGLQRLAR
ncbi:MAG: Holliday junction branch migration protein RuvA [Chthoniobacterales bacterium]